MRKKFLKIVLVLAVIFTFIHVISLNFYLYWQLWWLDILMHFFGGLWVTSLILWLLLPKKFWQVESNGIKAYFFLAFLVTSVVALFWEVFEFNLGATFTTASGYKEDTVSDVLSTLTGALFAVLFVKRILLRNFQKKDIEKA